MIVEVYIEGQRLDLYEDESITVKQLARDIKDISKVYADFSQSFNVPASNRNNEIFKHYYNANIDGGYDSRIRKEASLVVNGLDFKRGKMRMDTVDIKNGKATNYKITFFGNVIKVKDLIGDDRLFDLDWLNNFNHDYDGATVKDGLVNGLDFTVDGTTYDQAIVYPLISYKRQFIYNSDSSDHTNTDTRVNIHYHTGHSGNEHGVDYKELKPAIRLSLIIEAIQRKYGLIFNSPFFDSVNFTELYMNLNKEVTTLANGLIVVEDLNGTITPPANVLNAVRWRYRLDVTPAVGFETVPYKKKLYFNNQLIYQDNNFVTGTTQREQNTDIDLDSNNYAVRAEIVTEQDFECEADTLLRKEYITLIVGGVSVVNVTAFDNNYPALTVDIRTIITEQLKDIKVLDFLTSLFKMFNLVVVALEDNEIYIQDLQSYYEEGRIFDVTQFIETKKEVVKRGDIFSDINFKFKDTEQILADEFEQTNNQSYGNLEFRLTDANGNPLQDVDGESLEIDVIFENPIFERIIDISDNTPTSMIYCLYANRQLESISGNPFLFYARPTAITENPIGFLTESTYDELQTQIYVPSHARLLFVDSFNVNFGAEINEYTGAVMTNTIYDEYYRDYIGDIFSVKRRTYEFSGILPPNLLNNLRLNDRLIIKGTRYIINSISSNLVKRRDTLELINDIFEAPLASDALNTSLFRNAFLIASPDAATYSNRYIGITGQNIVLVDLGDGNTWIDLLEPTKQTQANIFEVLFTLDANGTGNERSVGVKVNDGLNNPQFIIIQDP
jgi:hypothetical protein